MRAVDALLEAIGDSDCLGWSAVTERLLDRETVERVLRRASDLADIDEAVLVELGGVSEQALLDAAVEIGLPAAAVRRALAVERLDPSPRPHIGDRFVGAGVVAVDAEVLGSASGVLARLDAWLVDGHHLRRDRLRDGRGVWSKRRGIVGRTVRTVRLATGEGQLGGVRRVSASASDTGTGTTVMRVEVDQSSARGTTAAGTVVAALATASSIVLAVVAGPLFLVAAPIGLAAVVGVAGGGRARADAVALEIDRVLDAVDECVAPTRLRTDVARRAGRQKPPVGRLNSSGTHGALAGHVAEADPDPSVAARGSAQRRRGDVPAPDATGPDLSAGHHFLMTRAPTNPTDYQTMDRARPERRHRRSPSTFSRPAPDRHVGRLAAAQAPPATGALNRKSAHSRGVKRCVLRESVVDAAYRISRFA